MRVNTKEFKQIEKITDPIINKSIKDHDEYIDKTVNIKEEDTEVFVREGLENVVEEIQQWFMDKYDFRQTTFDNFLTLDQLIYHKDGWSLSSSIHKHYENYNKHRDKNKLKDKINNIIINESRRLRNSIFDEANEREKRFPYVTISGEDLCGHCGIYYGTFTTGSNTYFLPPYHRDCECWAVYHDQYNV